MKKIVSVDPAADDLIAAFVYEKPIESKPTTQVIEAAAPARDNGLDEDVRADMDAARKGDTAAIDRLRQWLEARDREQSATESWSPVEGRKVYAPSPADPEEERLAMCNRLGELDREYNRLKAGIPVMEVELRARYTGPVLEAHLRRMRANCEARRRCIELQARETVRSFHDRAKTTPQPRARIAPVAARARLRNRARARRRHVVRTIRRAAADSGGDGSSDGPEPPQRRASRADHLVVPARASGGLS